MAAKKKKVDEAEDRKQENENKSAETESAEKTDSSGSETIASKDFPVVGIGASAGGLEALEGFLRNVKSDCNMAFVIIQHRATEAKSVMVSLLKKHTSLEVMEIKEETEVRPGCIYINPPHKDITIVNGTLYCDESSSTYGVRLPIDYFFRSLAKDHNERSICIVLSGTGTDGTLGLKAVKAAGGMTMVQNEDQAAYSAMPRNAIDTGQVDFVLPVEEMADELVKYVRHPYLKHRKKPPAAEEKFENALQRIFRLIRSETGHDFSKYKRKTIRRRIERRMAVHQISKINEYIKLLQKNSDEVRALFRDMIITVTNFFRDPEAFKALKEKAVTDIVRNKNINSNIRIWIPGCATGEEAYSIAIVFAEVMDELKKKLNIQIFATDIDSKTISTARYGEYPDSIAADISNQRLKKFFTQSDSTYKVKDRIRDMLVFAEQDVIKDAPFSKLDLICCRNVLIYMGPELQRKLIPLFHYTLNPDGYLFLGTSETIGQFADLFTTVDSKQRIFKRKPHSIARYEHPTIPLMAEPIGHRPKQERKHNREIDINRFVEQMILREYSLPCVVVNSKYDIIYFNGDTSQFLAQPGGRPATNILEMAKPELQYSLGVFLRKAQHEGRTVTSDTMHIGLDDHAQRFNLIVRPVTPQEIDENLLIVIFDTKSKIEKPSKEKEGRRGDEDVESHVKGLEQELASTKEYLQTTIEELETSNEELKSSNEELQSTNEELQSTNEELETSREELQSTNEELRTVNTEHQSKIDELAQANDDLSNLLISTKIATVFLDTELRIKRFTPESKSLFKFIDSDVGRPIDDIVNNLEHNDISKDAGKVLDTLNTIDREVKTKAGDWLQIKIAPYRTIDNVIDGVVITAFDINREKFARNYADSVVETIRHPLIVLNEDLKVLFANTAFYRHFKVSRDKTQGKFIYDLGNKQWDIPKLRKLLEDILPENTTFENFEVEHEFPNIGKRKMILNARQIQQVGEKTRRILLAIEDVTKK